MKIINIIIAFAVLCVPAYHLHGRWQGNAQKNTQQNTHFDIQALLEWWQPVRK